MSNLNAARLWVLEELQAGFLENKAAGQAALFLTGNWAEAARDGSPVASETMQDDIEKVIHRLRELQREVGGD